MNKEMLKNKTKKRRMEKQQKEWKVGRQTGRRGNMPITSSLASENDELPPLRPTLGDTSL
jgi:hypothetical protein